MYSIWARMARSSCGTASPSRWTSWSRVPGLGLESERPAWRARRGLGAGFPLDFFEGTTNLTKRKNIVTEGKAVGGEMLFKCCRAEIKKDFQQNCIVSGRDGRSGS